MSATSRVIVVPAGQAPWRLDRFVSTQSAQLSRTAAQRWIAGGLITVNDRPAKPAQRIRPGDVIASHVARRAPLRIEPEAVPLSVLHEDPALLVIDKPAGVVMHPAPGNWTGTLLNALLHHVRGDGAGSGGSSPAESPAHLSGDDQRPRPGLVHRLDKGTSGVVVIAKTGAAHRALSRQFHGHAVHRVYLALVAGTVKRGGVIDAPVGRDVSDGRRVSTRSARPQRAVTEFAVAEHVGRGATLVAVRPRTGRMHQIRVHLASIGHPVLGDVTYGGVGAGPALGRPMLHAAELGFVHPSTGERVRFRAALPADMQRAIADQRGTPAR